MADNSVNSAFTLLRTLIPTEPADRKLSKIETLRLASSYIAHLGTQLLAGKTTFASSALQNVDHLLVHMIITLSHKWIFEDDE